MKKRRRTLDHTNCGTCLQRSRKTSNTNSTSRRIQDLKLKLPSSVPSNVGRQTIISTRQTNCCYKRALGQSCDMTTKQRSKSQLAQRAQTCLLVLALLVSLAVGTAFGQRPPPGDFFVSSTAASSRDAALAAANLESLSLPAESRGPVDLPLNLNPNQASTLNQFVNLLRNYANPQQQQQQQPSLATMNWQRNQRPNQQAQPSQQFKPQLGQFSTPLPVFGAPINQINNNIRRPVPSNQAAFISSSPSTPVQTVNRLPNQQQQQQQAGQSQPNQQLQNGLRPQQIDSRLAPQLGQFPNRNQLIPRGQQQQVQPQPVAQFVRQLPQPARIPQPPRLQSTGSNLDASSIMRPLTGFTPSGPPPSFNTNTNINESAVGAARPAPTSLPAPLQPSSERPETVDSTSNKLAASVSSTELPQTEAPSSSSSPASTEKQPIEPPATSTATTSDDSMKVLPADGQPAPPSQSGSRASEIASSTQSSLPVESGSSWNPVDSNGTLRATGGSQQSKQAASLSPSPDIVTVPPGYNPDNPSQSQANNFDISVSAQMGADQSSSSSLQRPLQVAPSSSEQAQTSVAPTAVTTIFWSPPATQLAGEQPTMAQTPLAGPTTTTTPTTKTTGQPASTELPPISTTTSTTTTPPAQTETTVNNRPAQTRLPSRVRDSSHSEDLASPLPSTPSADLNGVVYGKTQSSSEAKPAPPSQLASEHKPGEGRPFIQSVQLDNQVRPYAGQARTGAAGAGAGSHDKSARPFRGSRPIDRAGNTAPMSVNSGFLISAVGNQTMPTGDIQDYLGGQPPALIGAQGTLSGGHGQQEPGLGDAPVISARGQSRDPLELAPSDMASSVAAAGSSNQHQQDGKQPAIMLHRAASNTTPAPSGLSSSSSSSQAPRVRRPTFKPKSVIPPIRIDSCIVGDDTSCEQAHNERCITEYGISSCHCKPGYARLSQLRGLCSPISALQVNLRIDKLADERPLRFNESLENPHSEEYQYLEYESVQALTWALQQSSLARSFMGAKVNKFFPDPKAGDSRVWANMTLKLDTSHANSTTTTTDHLASKLGQELVRVTGPRESNNARRVLGDSNIVQDLAKAPSVSKLTDVNECASRELNDCSKNAACINDFGGFQCQCLPGFEDKYQGDERHRRGRACMGCTASYCSGRGECSVVDGHKQCKCKANFVGARCDIDSEVMMVAIVGSVVGIIVLVMTFWCLIVFNRRWKREQQKMDAISASGGLYGQHYGASATGAGGGGGMSRRAYAAQQPDQQAIMGSTSSSSSAASQPIGGNPYNPYNSSFQYDDAGLLIPSVSTSSSSEQNSPTDNNYWALTGNQMSGAYTLSGHHHHHHQSHQSAAHNYQGHHHHHHHHQQAAHGRQHGAAYGKSHSVSQPVSQFHPGATDFRTNILGPTNVYCSPPNVSNYDARWRTLQQADKQSGGLVGYYIAR